MKCFFCNKRTPLWKSYVVIRAYDKNNPKTSQLIKIPRCSVCRNLHKLRTFINFLFTFLGIGIGNGFLIFIGSQNDWLGDGPWFIPLVLVGAVIFGIPCFLLINMLTCLLITKPFSSVISWEEHFEVKSFVQKGWAVDKLNQSPEELGM